MTVPTRRGGRVLVTYCSRRKSKEPGEIPAIQRYCSPRIAAAALRAQELGADFRILSGVFGILKAEDPLPYYDHLLAENEIAAMVDMVTPSLSVYDEVIFASVIGDFVAPYRAVLEQATRQVGIRLVEIALQG